MYIHLMMCASAVGEEAGHFMIEKVNSLRGQAGGGGKEGKMISGVQWLSTLEGSWL